ncbi:MAG: restriction endonuclease subunit S [Prolixibacteraceae bacterium]|nr:restriction endonuclease subunit S [Prolixibacteraceae bacterium]
MTNNKQKIPELRFPEFEGEWEKIKYNDIYSFHSTNSFSRDCLNYERGEVKNIHYGDIHTKFPTIFDIKKENVPFINPDIDLTKVKEENYCCEGDLVIADASEDYADIGKTIELKVLNNENVLAGLHTFLARPKKNTMAIGYAGYLMQSWKVRKQVMTIAQGTKVLGLSTGRMSKINLNIPTLPEQQKIASFLTAVDDKITQLSKKKELLEEYKKGVMQKIFKQEIRFKDDNGQVYPDWEEKKLGEVINSVIREVDKPKNNYLAIGVRSHCKGTFQKPDSDPNKIAMDKLYVVKSGDLVVNITFAWEGAIAMVKEVDDGGLVSHRFPTYRFNEELLTGLYFQYVFTQKLFRFKLELISPGGAGRNRVLSKSEFLKIKWKFPCLEEQQKIASFLTSIDQKIEQVNTQLEKAKTWKKGLLQKMFV